MQARVKYCHENRRNRVPPESGCDRSAPRRRNTAAAWRVRMVTSAHDREAKHRNGCYVDNFRTVPCFMTWTQIPGGLLNLGGHGDAA